MNIQPDLFAICCVFQMKWGRHLPATVAAMFPDSSVQLQRENTPIQGVVQPANCEIPTNS